MLKRTVICCFLAFIGFGLFHANGTMPVAAAADFISSPEVTAKASSARYLVRYTAIEPKTVLAGLSQVGPRKLLPDAQHMNSAESAKAAVLEDDAGSMIGFVERFAESAGNAHRRLLAVMGHLKKVPGDMNKALETLAAGQSHSGLLIIFLILFLIYISAMAVEKLFSRLGAGLYRQLEIAPSLTGVSKFWGALLKLISGNVRIFIFAVTCVVLFLLLYGGGKSSARMLFLATLSVILISRILTTFSDMLCSPAWPKLRLMPLGDQSALLLHRILVRLIRFSAFGYIACVFFGYLGVERDTFNVIAIFFGTIIILTIAVLIWFYRTAAANFIFAASTRAQSASWLKSQFAANWHIPALIYLLILWLFWAGRLIVVESPGRGIFFISLLIVPVYFAVDRLGQWIVNSVIGGARSDRAKTMDSPLPVGQDATSPDVTTMATADADEGEARYSLFVSRFVRLFIFCATVFWLLNYWGIHLPFGRAITSATFDILVTLVLAHFLWRFAANYISRKLKEEVPQNREGTEQEEDEWGSAATLGRGHTLLPVLRKVIGSVLITVVIMTILSSIGVDIKPLLAGAGVVGIAVGFGARKLVSDIFSGFFFLIDDAFRVGEYLKAGNISGRVEKITLRNLFLRHHRGMLQIVPYSDLGPVTNFMRGGIVEKFNLEFPYNADIEKIRKVIKKVGQKLLKDKEMGPNFIKPLKSQGVRNIGDSVMTIRVKFTAVPGQHFLIRREAYREITEALEKKGIYYAHRKVIVDISPITEASETVDEPNIPAGTEANPSAGATVKPELIAAGAAAHESVDKKETKKEKS